MQINKELTNKYYENYIPCNCGDCRDFIKHIETEKPKLCEYLRTLGINPLKPFELMSWIKFSDSKYKNKLNLGWKRKYKLFNYSLNKRIGSSNNNVFLMYNKCQNML